jgi:hypothetical protein
MTELTSVYVPATVSLPGILRQAVDRAQSLAIGDFVPVLSRANAHRVVVMPTSVALALHSKAPDLVLVPPPPAPVPAPPPPTVAASPPRPVIELRGEAGPEATVPLSSVMTAEPSAEMAEPAVVKAAPRKKPKSKKTTTSARKSRSRNEGESNG